MEADEQNVNLHCCVNLKQLIN